MILHCPTAIGASHAGLAFFVVCVFVCYLAYLAILGGRPEAMTMLPQFIGQVTGLFWIPGAILGITAWHRGAAKREAITGQSMTPVAGLPWLKNKGGG